ncbi:SpoIIE family protein phosphatase [Amycolatopsis acidicola]|uniref:SpoIIE family protein phosphatase n=1 Tax=Amycolatopsis acidicola TaxID=2596893 RepID=A0A5N0US78_9PSEU|nr:GAF domain-containing SpoIIE family protein phosphatase [Amycolatopsis acidicola]KAA9150727.1 SpoIIE family protein phosphatase [Amycolatopsis acidicola]
MAQVQVPELTGSLTSSLNLRRTALRLLDLAVPRLADWAVLALSDLGTGDVVLYGERREGLPAEHPPGHGSALGRVLRSGRTELLHVTPGPGPADALTSMIPHDGLQAEAAALRPAEVLGLGITARGTTIGVLVLVRGAERGFSEEDVAFAEGVARRSALALDSARLYEERRRVAATLQASLRPPELPEIPHARLAASYRPAAEHLDIGGDFYDAHGQGDDWLLALGDVSGKGVEAAVLTGRARQSIRTAGYFDRNPARILSALNNVLHRAGDDRFITVVCARLRPGPESAHVQLAVAGHPPPLVLRANGTLETPEVRGTIAGVLEDLWYHQIEFRLCHGDTMLMVANGVFEARGAGSCYGMERLEALLPGYAGAAPGVVCEAVERDVLEFLGGRPREDLALLAVTCGR